MTILTISSQVLYGHVGNAVADFTLKRLGFPVIAVPTVVLSNHKGYSDAVGEVFGPDLLRDFFSALERRGAIDDISAVQTGFIATSGQAQTIFDFLVELRQSKPDLPNDDAMMDLEGPTHKTARSTGPGLTLLRSILAEQEIR